MGDVFTTQDVRDMIEQLEATGGSARWPDSRYRLTVHPSSMVGRALRSGRSVEEVKQIFGVELVGDAKIVAAPTAHELAAMAEGRTPIAHGSYRVAPGSATSLQVGIDFAKGMRPQLAPELARAERARLRKWRSPGRKGR